MNKDKIKWLYQITYNSYYDMEFCNIPCIRRKSNYRQCLRFNDICKEFKVKGISPKKLNELNPYNDDQAMAWNERKNWKRNSKRKHQWKVKTDDCSQR